MTYDPKAIDAIIKSLDREKDQEDRVRAHRDSFFDGAPGGDIIVARAREYDDLEKHLVRKEYWLRTAREVAKNRQGQPLRLLTLPGRYRFEIEMYRSEGFFGEYNPDSGLPVVGFETSPEIFGLLQTAEPRLQRLFHADLVTALVDDKSNAHQELVKLFPFDIINLDLTNNLVAPSDGPYGPVLKAVRECFRLQGVQTNEWALMLTFRAVLGDTSPDTIKKLASQYQSNLEQHPSVKQACYNRYSSAEAEWILANHPEEALGQFAAKWIVDQAHSFDFKLLDTHHLQYSRQRGDFPYSITKLVFRFKKERLPQYAWPGKDTLPWYIDDLIQVVSGNKHVNISSKLKALRESKADYINKLETELESMRALFDDAR